MIYMEKCLKEFMTAMEMDKTDSALWNGLVQEEKIELLKEGIDLLYVLHGLKISSEAAHYNITITSVYQWQAFDGAWYDKQINEVYEGLCEIFDPSAIHVAFERVHRSNMSKLGDDGKPVRREDGKVMKGPNYEPPNLEDLV